MPINPINPNKLGDQPEDKPRLIRHVLEFTEEEVERFLTLLGEAENEVTPGDAPIWGHYKAAMVRAKISDGYYEKRAIERGWK